MALSPGIRLGSYEIVAAVGAGGMGEVYRARDTKLGREVALKILPEVFASDPERVARFAREARLLASLNHPHIAQIYGFEDGPAEAGPGDGRVSALVMEFVDGPTLADRIARSPIPLDEALPIARQICDALEAAHAQGIIHRDLKPANIKIRNDGTVKVLDFGLAKALDPGSAEALLHSPDVPQGFSPANSPTITAATRVGVILGTAAYMSPEQARSKAMDKRADIWAFGCVLFEMLTGRRAFGGEDVSDTLAFVITKEPDWSALPAGAPTAIRRLLRRCLEKDRRKRLADIADARIELDDAPGETASPPPAAARAGLRRLERLAWVAAVTFLSALVITLGILLGVRGAPERAAVRLQIPTPPTTDTGSLAVSRDGRQIVFGGTSDGQPRLWLRTLDNASIRPLAGTESAQLPFWSPDGRFIAFFADGKLKRMGVAAGAPLTLTDVPLARGGTWLSDGTIVFSAGITPLLRVSERGGSATPFTKLQPQQNSHRFPHPLPGEKHLIFYATGPADVRGVYAVRIDGSDMRRLFDADAGAVYITGHLLYPARGTMWAVPFDPVRIALGGDPVPLGEEVAFDLVYRTVGLAASNGSVLAFRAGEGARDRELVWLDRAGKAMDRIPVADAMTPALSPDGRRVALSRQVNQNIDIWILELGRNVFTRLTADEGQDSQPVWSADGQRVIFQSNRSGRFDLYTRAAGGTGQDELLIETPEQKTPLDASPDGRALLFRITRPNSQYDLWALPLGGDRTPTSVLATQFDERDGQFSPDGKWLAYQSNDSGRVEIYVRPFPGPGDRIQISTNGGAQARWRRDGRELFYIALDDRLVAVPIAIRSDARTLEPGTPVPLFATRVVGGAVQTPTKQQYVVSPDGQRFLINRLHPEAQVPPITVVVNWKPSQSGK